MFLRFLLSLTFIFLVHHRSFSQHDIAIPDSLASKSFRELEDLFYESKPDTLKAILYANSYYLKALKEKDTMKMLDGKYYLADIKNDDDLYLNYCDSLIEICKNKISKTFPTSIHLEKSNFLFHNGNRHEALIELTLAKNFLKRYPNDSLNNIYLVRLGLVKVYLKKYGQAITLYKKAYTYAKKTNELYNNDTYLSLPLNIITQYQRLNKVDSLLKYSDEAIKLYSDLKEPIFLNFSYFLRGNAFIKLKQYDKAILAIKKAIPSLIEDENYKVLCRAYSEIGKCYDSIKDLQNSLKYHSNADSIYNVRKIKIHSLNSSFSFLANYYKEQQDLEKQLHYINKLLELKEFELTEKNKIQQTFTNEFDIPNLLAERKRIVEEIEARSRRNQFVFISLLAISIGFIFYQVRKNRIQRKRFEVLTSDKKKNIETSIKTPIKDSKPKLELSESIVTDILKQLEKFEDNNEFVNVNLNLQNLASQFETNASYLSKVVNHYKQTSFSNYINQLRIEYCIEQLKNNKLWRKYTIKAIANEVGFNKAESFSKAFYKYTELRPSYFIKELKKTQTTNISNE
ncbi:helix-turn-helix domain-containing protein, partial [Tenacibaculum xiamenense]|uniref:helix-turn-helix domain-containing protein n=1 Tax=Tenacibaculum xiamenense TaxID=1261553 RepID=UPI0038B47FA3